ncbi:hypothetical protein AVEN_160528-1 [Araneus ventricosus]|uniref:RING-type domain-containing protein n=1 Tax=Araneus ventricosus TaxID=182803 RepID=A0A4Y2PCG4_ARAVE|nr:hypothetical protein AVEN_160528-1 [Araneus ventricosus]
MDYYQLTNSCIVCKRFIGENALPCGHLFHADCLKKTGEILPCPVCTITRMPCRICVSPMRAEEELHGMSCGCIHQEACLLPKFTRTGMSGCLRCCRKLTLEDRKYLMEMQLKRRKKELILLCKKQRICV